MTGMEKLRELAEAVSRSNECRIYHAYHGDDEEGCGGRDCRMCMSAFYASLAGEIEAEAALPEGMIWPRFEDGSPVAFRDKGLDVHGKTRSVEGVKITQGGFVFISDDMGNVWWTNDCGPMEEPEIDPNKRVKRPVKVLDADGVEIHEGDTVCGTRDMEPMKVVDTDSHECGFKRVNRDGRHDRAPVVLDRDEFVRRCKELAERGE